MRNCNRGPMTTDADGSHFDARTQFRGFFAVTWNDVANGPQRSPRVWKGRITAHWAGEQIRRDVLVDYVRKAPARVGPQISAPQARGRRRRKRGPSSYFALSSTSGPSSFLLNGWPNTSYAYTQCVLYDDFVCIGALCTAFYPPLSFPWAILFVCGVRQPVTEQFFHSAAVIYDVLRKLRVYLYLNVLAVARPLKLTEIYFVFHP